MGGKKLFGFVLGRKTNFAFGLTEKKQNDFIFVKKKNFELNIKTIPPPWSTNGWPLKLLNIIQFFKNLILMFYVLSASKHVQYLSQKSYNRMDPV